MPYFVDPVMLYKYPGKFEIHNDKFDYIVVEREEVEATIAAGWSIGTVEAKEAYEAVQASAPVGKAAAKTAWGGK